MSINSGKTTEMARGEESNAMIVVFRGVLNTRKIVCIRNIPSVLISVDVSQRKVESWKSLMNG